MPPNNHYLTIGSFRTEQRWRQQTKQEQTQTRYLLALLVGVYALLEVAAELNTLSSSARAAYLSEDALEWLGTETTELTGALPVVPKPLAWSPPENKQKQITPNIESYTFNLSTYHICHVTHVNLKLIWS